MNEIQIPHRGIDQCLKWRQRSTLEDPRPEQTVLVLPTRSRPDTAHDHQHMAKQRQMSFAPDSSSRHNQDARDPHAAQVISGQQGSGRERNILIASDGDRVCG